MKQFYILMAILFYGFAANSQSSNQLSGKVTDTKNLPVIGAIVSVKNATTRSATDSIGNFSIQAKIGDTLLIKYLGFKPSVFPIANNLLINITLEEDAIVLEEVQIIGLGYGDIKKIESSDAITVIKSDELTKIGTATPVQYLQGRAAGVQVIAENGEPGADMRVRIRGIGTINNSDPLYVVDGFPTANLSFLHPKDIESMEVLKDASATAIYGVRGANGVVLVKTKRGDGAKTKFTFDVYSGVANMWRQIPVNSASDYARLKKQAYANDGTTPDASISTKLDAANNQAGTDWQKEISQTGIIQSYYLNAIGGSKLNNWSVTGSLYDQTGTIKNTSVKKYFFNLANNYTFNKWLKGGIAAYFVRTEKNFNNSNEYVGGLNNAVITDPLTPVRDPLTGNWGYANMSTATNPARVIDLQKNSWNRNNNFTATAFLEATLTKSLSFKSVLGNTYTTNLSTIYVPVYNVGQWEQNGTSVLFENRGQSYRWVWSNYLDYDKTIGKHSINAIVGTESQAINYNGTDVSVSNVPEGSLTQYISASTGDPSGNTITSNQGESTLSSFFVRGHYAFDSKYLFTATVRRDGSSKFAPQYRWGTFPSFSLGWNVAKENFMKQFSKINTLKLRTGWGKVGNQNSINSDYAAYTLISGGNNYSFNGNQVAGFTIVNFGNSELKWEQTTTWNLGLDLEFWKKKVWATADYFIRKTDDMIIQLPTPIYAGANGAQTNAGSMLNKGIELAFGYKNATSYNLKYNVSANFTAIKNEVTSVKDAPIKGGQIWSIGYTTLTDKGMPVGSFWGLQTDGIFHNQQEVDAYSVNGNKIQPNAQAGDVKFKDQNGDGKIDEKDNVNLGSPIPKFTYGFTLGLEYKGFDLSVYVMGVYGNKIVNGLNSFTQASNGNTNSTPNRNNAWTPDNTNTNEPRMTVWDPNQNTRYSDRYIQDGSYTRIQNVNLGYTLPNKLVAKAKMSSFRIYIAADNLLTFTKYQGFDPEIGQTLANNNNPLNFGVDLGNYPQPRIFRAGMTLNF